MHLRKNNRCIDHEKDLYKRDRNCFTFFQSRQIFFLFVTVLVTDDNVVRIFYKSNSDLENRTVDRFHKLADHCSSINDKRCLTAILD